MAGRDLTQELEDRFAGGARDNGITLSGQQIADIANWLLGLNGGEGAAGVSVEQDNPPAKRAVP